MKRILTTVVICFCTILISSAQFDERFYFPSKEWNPIDQLSQEEFNFRIDQDTLNAILFKPVSVPKATIIFYHGAGGNISTYTFITKPLVKAGFQVFAIDFRGYGKSTGTPTHINIANDAQIIFDQIINDERLKNQQIIIYGASLGTQIATKIAKDNQEKISALILDGTISSFTDMALLSAPEAQKAIITEYVTSPYSAKEDIKEIENLPKLFIHSKGDQSVPFTQGETVYQNASEPKIFWEYEGNHLDAVLEYPELYIQKINSVINFTQLSHK